MQHASDYLEKLALVRPDWREAVEAYIERGTQPAGLIAAVLRNDLLYAVTRMDPDDFVAVRGLIRFLCFYAPSTCWGSSEATTAWRSHRGLFGLRATTATGTLARASA